MTDARPRSIAAAMRRLAEEHCGERFAVADLLAALGDQGFGLLILLLALPNVVPGPMLPGFSVPFAVAIALLGLQLAKGWRAPRLPSWLKQLSIERRRVERFVLRTEPVLLRLERWLKPRPTRLTAARGERMVGIALIALSLILALPVPFGNAPLALGIIIIALGLLEGDGRALTLGLVAGIAAAFWNVSLIIAGAELFVAATRVH